MSLSVPENSLPDLVVELASLPNETEWVEFKENIADPAVIGEYISALSNSAAMAGQVYGYMIWGVRDTDHAIVGTIFKPRQKKIGNEELENWLLRVVSPKINFEFFEVRVQDKDVVVLRIERAYGHPVRFQETEYIRIGSYKKKLKEFPQKERELWRLFDRTPFERLISLENVRADDVLRLLDYPAYFDLMEQPLPGTPNEILNALASERFVELSGSGGWNITNLGALLFAKRLSEFQNLSRKAARVIQYRGAGRIETLKEQVGTRGYANGFDGLVGYIEALLPANEVVERALRKDVPMFPPLAIREILANALIHQDFTVGGSGPMFEIFEDRIEFTSPGVPLMDPARFVDTPPQSRNEALASVMRRAGICEERGSGWDKIVFQTEYHQLPAPLVEVTENHTRVVLFAYRPLTKMDKEDRVRAVYLHACLRHVTRQHTTNTSVRERFGIEPRNSAQASRLIREAVAAGVIAPFDPEAAPKMRRYVPGWAASEPTAINT
ncbi:RNA-binding domain-containing protein [Paenarthrobacter sp.]|uniref:RNA-binding domain-containing protein n=1 Tax=Paenarthrobacter sp. TaxID=1931993 RepID=UPI002811DDDC|nr:RNA-binding domain-containing protein [Paenarthrobacter sp.]